MTEILMLCTANRCRSVMAGALLTRHLAAAGQAEAVHLHTAGLLRDGDAPPAEVISLMADYGIDVSGHRSRIVTSGDLLAADLTLTMTRDQVRRVAVTVPAVWRRSFTVKELIRRGASSGARLAGEPLASWLDRAQAGRDRAALLGESAEDDIADPFGGPPSGYAATAALLDRLLAGLAGLCWPGPSLTVPGFLPPGGVNIAGVPRVFGHQPG
jgi:protein-tyrosine-phosphatase